MDEDQRFAELLARSSLGSPAARELRERTTPSKAHEVRMIANLQHEIATGDPESADRAAAGGHQVTERATGGASEPRGDGPSFFVSYARPPGSPSRDDPSPIGELVQDLNFEIGQHVRQGTRQVRPGVSDREIPIGDNWRRFISHMLAEAHVLIALVSTPYLDSDWCGKEWAVFSRRAVHARPPLSPETSAILPVVWVPVPQDRRHAVVQRLQYTNERMPGSYARDGLLALSRQAGKRDSYHQVVNQLARRVSDLLMYTTVEPGRMVDVETAPSAFHQSKPNWDCVTFLESKAQG